MAGRFVFFDGDRSPRTMAIMKPTIAFIAAVVVGFACIAGWVSGHFSYVSAVKSASTKIGGEIKFSGSGSALKLAGIYTDTTHSVMIARLTESSDTQSPLPFKGSDYKVFVKSSAYPSGVSTVPLLFGRLGTDGDYLLIVPKPAAGVVYSFALVYTPPQVPGRISDSAPVLDAAGEGSIAKTLSQLDSSDTTPKSSGPAVSTPLQSVGLLRLVDTRGENANGDSMTVLPGVLIDPASNVFRYKDLFNQLYKNRVLASLNQQYKMMLARYDAVRAQLKNINQQLALNPDDTSAKQQYNSLTAQSRQLDRSKQDIAKQIYKYSNLEYDDSLFQFFNKQATVVH